MKIKFEISSDKVYNAEFIEKIKRSKKEYKQGDFVTIANEVLDSFLGL